MRRRPDLLILLGLATLAFLTNLAFRGMIVDDSTLAWEWADSFLGRRPLDLDNVTEDFPPLFPILLHLSFVVFGHDLVALHLPSFLACLVNPGLAYLVLRARFDSRRWGAVGGLVFLLWPTAVFFYNQALAEPVTLTIVLTALWAHERGRLGLYLVLAALSLTCAYDAVLVHLAVFVETVAGFRRSEVHRRAARLLVGAALAGLALLVADLLLPFDILPHARLGGNVIRRLDVVGEEIHPAKVDQMARHFFAYLLLPLALVGVVIEFRRRRGLWPALAVFGYIAYETFLRPYFLPNLVVTLRHLTLVVPAATILVVSTLESVADRWGERRPAVRWSILAYGGLSLLAVALVQARYGYFRSGIQIASNAVEIVRTDQPLPLYVWASERKIVAAGIVQPIAALGPGDSRRTLDLGEASRAADGPEIASIELVVLRGEVELAGATLLDRAGRIEPAPIPVDGWRSVSDFGRLSSEGGRLRLASDGGFLAGMAYPLDGPFVAGGRGDRLEVVLRGSAPFVINVVARDAGGNRVFFVFHPPLPEIVGDPGRVDRNVARTLNDQVHRACLGRFRPEGLWELAPLMGYDRIHYRNGRTVDTRPAGWIERRDEGRLTLGEVLLTPVDGEASIVYEASFDRPVAHLSLAAFVSHLLPGDRLTVALEEADGTWREVGRVEGLLRRSHWGVELARPVADRRTLRIRLLLEAADGVPDRLRRALPMGIRDLAIGVRLAAPETPHD